VPTPIIRRLSAVGRRVSRDVPRRTGRPSLHSGPWTGAFESRRGRRERSVNRISHGSRVGRQMPDTGTCDGVSGAGGGGPTGNRTPSSPTTGLGPWKTSRAASTPPSGSVRRGPPEGGGRLIPNHRDVGSPRRACGAEHAARARLIRPVSLAVQASRSTTSATAEAARTTATRSDAPWSAPSVAGSSLGGPLRASVTVAGVRDARRLMAVREARMTKPGRVRVRR
jgi:hypothetical protein